MRGGTAARFAIEAAFLVGVAVVLGSLNQRWPVILPAMAAALAVTYVSEWTAARVRRTGKVPSRAEPATAGLEGGAALLPEPASSLEAVARARPLEKVPEQLPEPVAEAQPEPEPPAPVVPEPPAPEPEPVAAEPVPPPTAPEPVPVLVAVPAPPPEPPVEEPALAPAAAAPEVVVQLPSRGPQEWNLWDLERLTREHSGGDAFRNEERAYLLVYLREFANPDGVLPVDFDGLVRESFGELVGTG
jgi:hypothetical protein